MNTTIQVNEITELDLIICYLDEKDRENFVCAWYFDLDEYKDNPDMLLLMANAVLTHWGIPLYAEDVSWHKADKCFIWHFKQEGNL